MKKKIAAALGTAETKKRASIIALLVIPIVVIALHLLPPQRSVASYCKVYKSENAKLNPASGSIAGNAHNYASAYGKLEAVAPSDIEPDVKVLKSLFDKIDKDPSQTVSASLSGISAESNVKNWTDSQCN